MNWARATSSRQRGKSGTNGTGKTGEIVNYELGTSYKLAPAGGKVGQMGQVRRGGNCEL